MPQDWGKVAQPHLKMIIKQMLIVKGWDCKVYAPVHYDNGYGEVYPEHVPDAEPCARGKVLVGQAIEGLNISDYIRLTDVTKQVAIVTNLDLEMNSQVQVTAPDGAELNLRVIECKAVHTMSKINWLYITEMT